MRHPPSYPVAPQPLARSAADILPPAAPLVVPADGDPHGPHGHERLGLGWRVAIIVALALLVLGLAAR